MLSPNANISTDYLSTPDFPALGDRWRSSHFSRSELVDTACGDMRVLALGVFTIESLTATVDEDWQIDYDGVLIPFTTAATVNDTADAIYDALLTVFGPGKALEEDVAETDGVTIDDAVVTIQFADGTNHAIELIAPGGAASTFTAEYSTEPSAPVDHRPGYWVAFDQSGHDPQLTRVKDLDSMDDTPIGVVVREGAVTEDESAVGPIWPSGRPMSVAKRMQIICKAAVEILAADIGKPVFVVATGVKVGQVAKSVGGTSEVWTGTVVANNADAVGLDIDDLPRVQVVSTADAAATATLLANAINARADLAAIVVATTDTIDVILAFRDTGEHDVAAYTPATADVTPLDVTTTAVAATAIPTKGSTFLTPAAAGARVAVNVHEG